MSKTIEEGIQAVRAQVIGTEKNKDLFYVPLCGIRTPGIQSEPFDLRESVQQFLRFPESPNPSQDSEVKEVNEQQKQSSLDNPRTVMLLQGDGGSGKSTFCQELILMLWQNYKVGQPIPLFISLPALQDPFHRAIEETLEDYGFNQEQIAELKKEHRFIFVLDGYDEIHQLQNIVVTNRLQEWQANTIITCRSQYLYHVADYEKYFIPFKHDKRQPALFEKIWVAPFSETQIKTYIQNYQKRTSEGELKETADSLYQKLMQVPGVNQLVMTPFLLKLAVEVLPELSAKFQIDKKEQSKQLTLTQAAMYDVFMEQWFKRQEAKLKTSGHIEKEVDMKPKFWSYCKDLALALREAGVSYATYVPSKSSLLKDAAPNRWEAFFGSEPSLELLRSGCPIRQLEKNRYGFIHASFIEYFATRALYEEEIAVETRPPIKEQNALELKQEDEAHKIQSQEKLPTICRKSFTREFEMVRNLADRVVENESFKARMFHYIELSKKEGRYAIAAANAITGLNRARVCFSGMDLNDVRIPEADCSQGVFHRTQMKRTNLKGVDFSRAYLQEACWDESNVENVKVGERAALKGHSLPIQCMAYDPTHHLIATGSGAINRDCGISVWDVETGALVQSLPGHQDTVLGLAFLPNTEMPTLISISKDKTQRQWDIITGESWIFSLPVTPKNIVTFSLDGALLGFVHEETDAKERAEARYISLWSLLTYDIQYTWPAHSKNISAIAFIPNKNASDKSESFITNYQLVSSGEDNTLKLWSLEKIKSDLNWNFSSKLLWSQNTPASPKLAFSADTQKILSCTSHGASVFQLNDGTLWQTLKDPSLQTKTLSLACASQYIAIGDGENIQIFDKTGVPQRFLSGHTSNIIELIFVPERENHPSLLLSASHDRMVRLWETQEFSETARFPQHTRSIIDITLTLDERTLITASLDGTIRFWEASTAHLQKTLKLNRSGITAFHLDTVQEHVIAGDKRGWVYIYHFKAENLRKFKAHTSAITHLNTFIDAKRQWLLSSAEDKGLKLWELPTHKLIKIFISHWALSLTYTSFFSKDGTILYTADRDGDAKTWDIENGTFMKIIGDEYQTSAILLSLDASQLLVAHKKNFAIEIWDLKSLKRVQHYEGPSALVKSLNWDATGEYLISGDEANVLHLWHRDNYKPILRFEMTAPIQVAILSNQAKHLYVAQKQDLTLYGFKLNHGPQVEASLQYQVGGKLNVQSLNINRLSEFPATLGSLFKSLKARGDSLNNPLPLTCYPTQIHYALNDYNLSPLRIAIYAQGEIQIRSLIQAKVDVNRACFDDWAPLQLAACRGSRDICECLIAAGANVNQATVNGRTPLFIAASYGQEKMVSCLLADKGTDPNQATTDGRTALYIAAQNGHTGVINLLLADSRIHANQATTDNHTPLCIAAQQGQEEVVSLLLADPRVNPNQARIDGSTPLFIAVQHGHTGVISLLLADSRVNPNQADKNGVTPLHMAAQEDFDMAVKLLLADSRVNPNQTRIDGTSPFHIAAQNGCDAVIKLLLTDKRADPNQAATDGRTPLFIAAQKGHTKAVHFLLANSRVKPNQPTASGDTPLCIAAQEGKEGAVHLLLADKRTNPNQARTDTGATPLYMAAQNGNTEVINLLLADLRIKPNQPRSNGVTPLCIAAFKGYKEIVRLLLADNRVDPNQSASNGVTPLYMASQQGYERVVKLLLTEVRVDPNKAQEEGATPLYVAAQNGFDEVVSLLLADKRVDPNQARPNGVTPLYLAVQERHEEVVRLLLSDERVNPNQARNTGATPLFIASLAGCEGLVKLLLANGRVNPDQANNNGTTPLFIAAHEGHKSIIKFLLDNKANIRAKDKKDNTVLHWACMTEGASKEMIDLLLQYGADLHYLNGLGETGLQLCERTGNLALAQYLRIKMNISQSIHLDGYIVSPLLFGVAAKKIQEVGVEKYQSSSEEKKIIQEKTHIEETVNEHLDDAEDDETLAAAITLSLQLQENNQDGGKPGSKTNLPKR